MTTTTMPTEAAQRSTDSISRLQGDAWAAWNASYHVPAADDYRDVSLRLYQEDMHERIAAIFARSDEQNAYLDAHPAA